jgi:glucose-1-phosphate cytidylyltransferase
MKVVILAGGLGTRISEETSDKPKPMVQVAGKPMLWHIMSIFAKQGYREFVVATGYKGEVIREWISSLNENWSVRALETGLDTQTGGRLKMAIESIGDERIMATYGDGLANINVSNLLQEHSSRGLIATVTAVRPPARFGVLESQNGLVTHFGEKNQADAGWINGGFFVLEPSVGQYVFSTDEPFETGAMPRMVMDGQLGAFQHEGFWKPMDTLREKHELTKYAALETPPWLQDISEGQSESLKS